MVLFLDKIMVIRIEVQIETLKKIIIIEITIIDRDKQMNANMLKKINLCC